MIPGRHRPDHEAKEAAFLLILTLISFALGMYGLLMAFGIAP